MVATQGSNLRPEGHNNIIRTTRLSLQSISTFHGSYGSRRTAVATYTLSDILSRWGNSESSISARTCHAYNWERITNVSIIVEGRSQSRAWDEKSVRRHWEPSCLTAGNAICVFVFGARTISSKDWDTAFSRALERVLSKKIAPQMWLSNQRS